MIDYENFRKALKNLEKFWEIYQADAAAVGMDQTLMEMRKMGLIKGYEICVEATFKALRRHIVEDLLSTELGTGKHPIIRAAHENDILSATPEQWMQYVKIRNMTSHEYGDQKTAAVIATTPAFLEDCVELYQTVTGKKWE